MIEITNSEMEEISKLIEKAYTDEGYDCAVWNRVGIQTDTRGKPCLIFSARFVQESPSDDRQATAILSNSFELDKIQDMIAVEIVSLAVVFHEKVYDLKEYDYFIVVLYLKDNLNS